MNTHFRIFQLVFIILVSAAGCKEKDCHKDGTCAPDYRRMPLGEAKNYLWSLPGSYWIYRNKANGFLDTQICFDFLCDTIIVSGEYKDTKHITVEYERIRRAITSSYNNWIIYEETNGYNANYPRELKALVRRYANKGGEIASFYYPCSIGEEIGLGGVAITTCIGIDSTIKIQGKTYINIIKFNVDFDETWSDLSNCTLSNNLYYWAKDVGLVKKDMITCNTTWELIDYKVIK